MDDILDEIEEYLDRPHRYSDYISCTCVFHSDVRPSMMIYEDFYKCLACDAHGRTDKLLEKLKSKLHPTLKTRPDFRNPFTVWTRKDPLPSVLKRAWKLLNDNPSQGSYLRGRGIPDDVRYKLKIGWLDGWLTFPILDQQKKIIGAVARIGDTGAESKYIVPSGQNPDLIYVPDWDIISKAKEIYCVFGILDAITLYLYNVPSFSTTTGKRLNPMALDQFRKRIIFIPDQGEEDAALKIISKLGWRGALAKMYWPDKCKDISDIHKHYPDLLVQQFGVYK